jgi:GPI transamidase subunit PIG-U
MPPKSKKSKDQTENVPFPYKTPDVKPSGLQYSSSKSSIEPQSEQVAERLGVIHMPIWSGIWLRVFILIFLPSLQVWLFDRVEISTPVTSFKRLLEGVHLFKNGLPIYEGGIYHQVIGIKCRHHCCCLCSQPYLTHLCRSCLF